MYEWLSRKRLPNLKTRYVGYIDKGKGRVTEYKNVMDVAMELNMIEYKCYVAPSERLCFDIWLLCEYANNTRMDGIRDIAEEITRYVYCIIEIINEFRNEIILDNIENMIDYIREEIGRNGVIKTIQL